MRVDLTVGGESPLDLDALGTSDPPRQPRPHRRGTPGPGPDQPPGRRARQKQLPESEAPPSTDVASIDGRPPPPVAMSPATSVRAAVSTVSPDATPGRIRSLQRVRSELGDGHGSQHLGGPQRHRGDRLSLRLEHQGDLDHAVTTAPVRLGNRETEQVGPGHLRPQLAVDTVLAGFDVSPPVRASPGPEYPLGRFR